VRKAAGARLARREAQLVLWAEALEGHLASAGVDSVEAADSVSVAGGAGEVGASASDGRSGAAIGARTGRSAGIPGGMARVGMLRWRTPTTPITATIGQTIRRRTLRIRRMRTIRLEAT
jgi:hypothetical protein